MDYSAQYFHQAYRCLFQITGVLHLVWNQIVIKIKESLIQNICQNELVNWFDKLQKGSYLRLSASHKNVPGTGTNHLWRYETTQHKNNSRNLLHFHVTLTAIPLSCQVNGNVF